MWLVRGGGCLCGYLPYSATPGLPKRAQTRINPSRKPGLLVYALDAAQPFDFESRAAAQLKQSKKLKVGIVGFGNFGQFLARRFAQHGHTLLAVSRSDHAAEAATLGVAYFSDADDFAEQHPDIVVLASSILSARAVLDALPLQRLRRSTLFVDVLSVKVFPKQLLLDRLPPSMDILCTHPMFGPESGRGSWQGLPFQYERVRIAASPDAERRAEAFLDVFSKEGCKMVEMTCEEHDRQAANTQFITHTVGRVLGEMQVESMAINTRGYDSLLSLVENTANDSFDLYYGLFMYNQNSTDTLDRLEHAFDNVKRRLFSELHSVVREQIFPLPPSARACAPPQAREGSSAGDAGGAMHGADGGADGEPSVIQP